VNSFSIWAAVPSPKITVELVGRFDPVTVYDTGDPTDTVSVVGERVREGEEEELQLELVQVEEQFGLVQLEQLDPVQVHLDPVQVQLEPVQVQLEPVQVGVLDGIIVIVVCVNDP
jgi:hypothetical protein